MGLLVLLSSCSSIPQLWGSTHSVKHFLSDRQGREEKDRKKGKEMKRRKSLEAFSVPALNRLKECGGTHGPFPLWIKGGFLRHLTSRPATVSHAGNPPPAARAAQQTRSPAGQLNFTLGKVTQPGTLLHVALTATLPESALTQHGACACVCELVCVCVRV